MPYHCLRIKETLQTSSTESMKQKMQIKTQFLYRLKSLCTNIPNHERIEAIKGALNSISQKPFATKPITKFFFLILVSNSCS